MAGVAAYFSSEVAALRWLALSASAMFVIEGPLRLALETIVRLYDKDDNRYSSNIPPLIFVLAVVYIPSKIVGYILAAYCVAQFAIAL